jgi:serine/threonine-protein kinase RsbW/stage II sporulation protein AB (anti-sigma F factor)
VGGERPGALTRTVPARPEAVPALRHAVEQFATALGAGGRLLDELRLAVSEAVTNVILHAYVGRDEPGPVELTAAVEGEALWVAVRDEGGGMVPRLDSPGLGLGLPLIARATQDLEVHQPAAGGTEIRMTFRLAG